MAAISQTPSSIAIGADAQISKVVAGEAITQGMPVYLKTSDGKYWKADADTLAESLVAGIAVTPAGAADASFVLQRSGLINLGATLTVGLEYYLHTTAGAIGVIGELSTGDFPCRLGFATTAAWLQLAISAAGVAKP